MGDVICQGKLVKNEILPEYENFIQLFERFFKFILVSGQKSPSPNRNTNFAYVYGLKSII